MATSPLSRSIAGAAVLVAAAAAFALLSLSSPAPPEVLARVPDFDLVSDDGSAFGPGTVAGRPWIASFLYTSCPGPCPRLVERLKKLRRAVPATEMAIVSITVDPETDTPEVLAEYRRKHGIGDADNWYFVTGPPPRVLEVVQKGFLTGVGPGDGSEDEGNVAHGVRIALVDGEGAIRGFYHSESDEDLDELARDVATLR